ncbi:hypothetical protein HN588_07265, partial [Candidatus Bathyarchaeota archaeon]|nr:hypothetical protein [Candidatus Bathyarchaeota archaeon]
KGERLWIRRGRESFGVVFAVRRKLGNAVKRNRLKRRLRVICRHMTPIDGGLVIFPQASAIKARFRDLEEELGRLILQL